MEAILSTKINPPLPVPNLISRPRLIERLLVSRPLTLLSAPPGFGKTTLINEWRTQGKIKFAWLSLDADDNDPQRFIAYFIAALQTVKPEIGAAGALLLQSTAEYKNILTSLLNDLNKLDAPIVLVLDDYHEIHTDSIHDALSFILDHQPASLRLVLSTRNDPPLPLARLRGRGQLTEIRADDLRFTNDETTSFLNQIMGLNLSSADVAALEERAEGWIAGLQMAAVSMHGKADVHVFISTFTGSHQFIGDYLTEEIFIRQPNATQDFLLQTSILDRFCMPLCDTVTQRRSSQDILNELSRDNVFLVPLDNERTWFRYHHLFSEFLRARVRDANELHLRASQWFEKNGYISEAVKHAIAAQDYKAAIRLIKENSPTMIARGEISTFLRWVKSIPFEFVNADARLSLYVAIANFIVGNESRAEQAFRNAETALAQVSGEEHETIRAEIEAMRLSVSIEHGAQPEDIGKAKTLLEIIPKENNLLRASLYFGLGDAYQTTGNIQAAIEAFAESKRIGENHDNPLSTLAAGYEIAELYLEQGQLRKAEAVQRSIIKSIEARVGADAPLPALGGAYIGLGKVQYQRNELADARRSLKKGIDLAKQPGGLGMARRGLLTLAFVAQAEGQEKEAGQIMKQAEELTRNSPRRDAMPRFMIEKVRFWLLQGNLSAPARWAREREQQSALTEIQKIAIARVELARRNAEGLDKAQARLAGLRPEIEAQGRNGLLIQMLMLESLIHHAKKNPEMGMPALEECLALAEPEKYIRLFLDEGKPMLELLGLALREGIAPEYARALIEAFRHGDKPAQPLVEPLSERELEVLGLLNMGASNAVIAKRLVIAVGTVKRHTLSIYQKLGVNSRTQAIARARELNLLQ